jgi:light-regulated signal transduction histidine kinase (bacteriophytochrome)
MVTGFMGLLQKRYQGKLDPEADEFIAFAVDGSRRMQALINDLLAFSRVGTRAATLEPTDLGQVVNEALLNLRATLEESGANVTVGPLPTVDADRRQMIQLFQNLIGNAIKFRSKAPPQIHVAALPDEQQWRFSVQDNGIGLDQQFADRIFLVFQRLHGREEYPGTGIGLAVSRRIVEHHGGRLWVESEPGKGATFHFTIPAGAREPRESAPRVMALVD